MSEIADNFDERMRRLSQGIMRGVNAERALSYIAIHCNNVLHETPLTDRVFAKQHFARELLKIIEKEARWHE